MLAIRGAAKRRPAWAGGPQQRRTKSRFAPKSHSKGGGPLPSTPWTVRGPPPGAPLPWYLRKTPSVREQCPELDVVTYEGKMHYVPWLAKPMPKKWERGWHSPSHHRAPRLEELPSYKPRPCYICHQRTRLLEGSSAGPGRIGNRLGPRKIIRINNSRGGEGILIPQDPSCLTAGLGDSGV